MPLSNSILREDGVTSFLRSRGASEVAHLSGTLLEHCEGTRRLLREWANPQPICDTGLCHAVYGTFGFPHSLLHLSERGQLAELIGPQAEGLVYFYASCDRPYVYPQIGRTSEVQFRDRFTGEVSVPQETLFCAFMEVTFANELDLARQDEVNAATVRSILGELFQRSRSLVSGPAFACFLRLCGS
jgi:hypothetical protein